MSTTPLPLQESGLAVGGDVQDRATDIAEVGLTQEQVDRIMRTCHGVIVFGTSGDEPCVRCSNCIPREKPLCGPRFAFCERIRAYAKPDQKVLGQAGYVEVTDEQPGKPRCGSEAAGVCMRLGASSAAALDRVVEKVTRPQTTTPSETSTTPRSTSPTTSTDNGSTTPTTTTPTSAPPTSSAGAHSSLPSTGTP